MFRCAVLCVFITLLSIASSAQIHFDESSAPGPQGGIQQGKARTWFYASNTPEARVSIVRLREPRRARQLYNKALQAYVKEKTADAIRTLDEALKLYPAFPEALTLYGSIQIILRQWQSAEQNLRASIHTDPTYVPGYLVLAGLYNAQGRFDDGLQVTRKAVSAGAAGWDVEYEIARGLIGKGQYQPALLATENGLRLKQHGSLLHLAKAHALVGLRKYRSALQELRAYLRYQPSGAGSEQARDLLAKVESVAGE
jgi:predicted Zn-dependent protease